VTLFEEGVKKRYISINDDNTQITYCHQNKKRNYSNPEEKVQAETYLMLILHYGYKPEQIELLVPVTMGSGKREADIVVFNDDDHAQPHILIECKKQDVSEQEFLQAIEQAYSYAYALPNDVKYIWVTSGLKNEYFEVNKQKKTRITLPDIPQYGVKKLANYKYVYDAQSLKFKAGEQQFFDLEVISEDELTRQFKQAHNALWGGGQLNPSEAFDELDKLIFCKIWDERKDRVAGEPYDFQIITIDKEEIEREAERTLKENAELLKRIYALYEEGRKKDTEVFRDNIRLSPEKIRTVVSYLQGINLGETDLDAKGRAFETFMDSFFRGNFGQYFTPRPIVKFITDVLPITNESRVLDTSCGSGGFLLYALDKIRRKAEEMYPEYKTDVKQNRKHYKYWHDFAEKNLFGIEINEQISRAAKMNMIIHDDGHTNVISLDGLLHPDVIKKRSGNDQFQYGTFNFIITNPPFGSAVRLTEQAYLKTYNFGISEPHWLDTKNTDIKDRETQSTEILFIERAYHFLREEGYLGIVIPDGVLTNSSLQYVRNKIEEWYRIVAVVSMPQTAFTATGAGVKSSVLFLRKWTDKESETIVAQKKIIQEAIKDKAQYLKKTESFEMEKKRIIKNHIGFTNTSNEIDKKQIETTEEFKSWKTKIMDDYNQKIAILRESLEEKYQEEKNKKLANYPIFMAIAEDIGYDATGRLTNSNEFDIIGPELANFINAIEQRKL